MVGFSERIGIGLLALLAVMPVVLMSVAVVVFGGVLLLGASVVSRLNALSFETAGMNEHGRRAAREAVSAAASVQVLLGLSALTLGILALVGIATPTLILVGLLTTGAAIAFSGTALTSRMLGSLTA